MKTDDDDELLFKSERQQTRHVMLISIEFEILIQIKLFDLSFRKYTLTLTEINDDFNSYYHTMNHDRKYKKKLVTLKSVKAHVHMLNTYNCTFKLERASFVVENRQ